MNLSGRVLFCVACLLAVGAGARAQVTVSVGYYDLPPVGGNGNTNALPNPWYSSANTTFLGSTAQATSSDPDESAILFTNTGATAVTLDPGVNVKSGANSFTLWDSLIGGGISIAPGTNVILSGTIANSFDGSDIPLALSTISFSLNGTPYSVVDTGSILFGSPLGSADETEPWTQIGQIGGPATTPEPASMLLFGTGLLSCARAMRRKRGCPAAS
jgi:PEP-CTERM motif